MRLEQPTCGLIDRKLLMRHSVLFRLVSNGGDGGRRKRFA